MVVLANSVAWSVPVMILSVLLLAAIVAIAALIKIAREENEAFCNVRRILENDLKRAQTALRLANAEPPKRTELSKQPRTCMCGTPIARTDGYACEKCRKATLKAS